MRVFGGALGLVLLASAAAAQSSTIDWAAARQAASQADSDAIAFPVNRDRSVLDTVRVPVLLPALQGVRARAGGEHGVLFFARGRLYAASFRIDIIELEITGMSEAGFSRPGTGGAPNITRTETGQEASFTRFGAGYSVAVRCSDHAADPRCTDPEFLNGVIGSLSMAGGQPG